MGRIPLFGAWLTLGVCLLGAAAASAGTAEPAAPVSRELLDRAGLWLVWESTLPLLGKENIDALHLVGDRLDVQSSENYVWSLDRNTGKTVFAESIAARDLPVLGWTTYEDRLITVINNQIVEFNRDSGVQEQTRDPEVGIVAPVARNSEYFYVAGVDRRVHAFKAKGMVHVFDGAVSNDSMMTSVLADDDMIVVATEGGNLTAMAADMPRKLWEFDAPAGIVGPVIRDADAFYFACKDTYVYRIDQVSAKEVKFVWRHQIEAFPNVGPRVTPNAVYQYAPYRGLSAIDKEHGTALWVLPEGRDLLAEAGGRAYVLTRTKTLAVMDNATGKCVYCANFGAITKYVANTTDGRLYVADERGHVVCLQPR